VKTPSPGHAQRVRRSPPPLVRLPIHHRQLAARRSRHRFRHQLSFGTAWRWLSRCFKPSWRPVQVPAAQRRRCAVILEAGGATRANAVPGTGVRRHAARASLRGPMGRPGIILDDRQEPQWDIRRFAGTEWSPAVRARVAHRGVRVVRISSRRAVPRESTRRVMSPVGRTVSGGIVALQEVAPEEFAQAVRASTVHSRRYQPVERRLQGRPIARRGTRRAREHRLEFGRSDRSGLPRGAGRRLVAVAIVVLERRASGGRCVDGRGRWVRIRAGGRLRFEVFGLSPRG